MNRFHFNFGRPAAWLLFLLLSGGCTDTLELEWAASPDVIFINADIHTGVPPDGLINPTAVAVRNGEDSSRWHNGRDPGIGSPIDPHRGSRGCHDVARSVRQPRSRRTSLPVALMDWEGGLISEVPAWVREARTIADLQAAISREAERLGPGEWIIGALSREVWPNQILPTRDDLDIGTTTNPVLLTRGPHTTVLNSAALEMAGIDRTTTFPGGGHIGHDDNGEPNGRLYDSARRLARQRVAPAGGSQRAEHGKSASAVAAVREFRRNERQCRRRSA